MQAQDLITENMGLVRMIMSRHYYGHLRNEDAYSEGYLALCRAADTFIKKGYSKHRFRPYACTCIKNQIGSFLAKERMVSDFSTDTDIETVADDVGEEIATLPEGIFTDREQKIIELFLCGYNTKEVADRMEITVEHLRRIKRKMLRKVRNEG